MQSWLRVFGCCVLITVLSSAGSVQAGEMSTQARLVLAKVAPLMSSKSYGKAIALLEPALKKKETRNAELAFALGNCRMLGGQTKGAIKAYSLAVQLAPKHASAWLNLARAQYESKAYKEAGHSFGQAYKHGKSKKAQTLYFSAASYQQGRSYQRAITAYERLFSAHRRSLKAQWREQYIHALVDGGQRKKALPLIREQITRSSGEQKTRWQEVLLSLYMRFNMHKQGTELARQLIEDHPEQAKWWKALTHIQLAANRYEDGLAALIGYSMLGPMKTREKKLLADLYLQTGIPAKAAPLYRQLLRSKSDAQIVQRLALSYRQLDQPDKALQVLHGYGNLKSKPNLLMLEGEICYRLKRFGEATNSYQSAAKIKGRHQGQSWLMAGYSAMQAHDYASSRRALANAVKYDRAKKAATLALSQIEHQRENQVVQ
ncbi:tetratricopeptide repeat protein [Desulfobulbus rhabdoformis]|uniref:tetratricopeptide repeat protein n=1 Tax=Desulfobulbus rhabdoformis TaxID=34032 RepID=UPI001964D0B6|nr:tetratricopeptide repeat protein [Desulfobulbus rhabdoformis]MBM9614830.1 tetratricopeptide repeat protein [Desulfobulbus rhabdoformis]